MHGCGNDFMVIDGVTQNVYLSPEKIKQLADRNFGIGFDQLLLVEPPYDPDQDFHYRIFNADGSEVEQCGNGARCFARFVKAKGLINKNRIAVSTKSGNIVLYLERDGQVTVNMGMPNFKPDAIPLQAQKQEKTYIIRDNEQTFFVGVVSMGNPHCVIMVDDVDEYDVLGVGERLESHERFPARVNVGFMQVISRNTSNYVYSSVAWVKRWPVTLATLRWSLDIYRTNSIVKSKCRYLAVICISNGPSQTNQSK